MSITVQGATFQSSVGTPWNIPSGVAIFVQPGSGGTVIDYDTTRQNYMAMYGVDPLGQITPNPNATIGSAAYALSQTYYLNNPSTRFQNLTQQYEQQHYSVLGSSGVITPAQQAAFIPYNTPATEQMVAEKSANLGALYAVGGITAAGLQSGVTELSRQYNYTQQSLGNIATSAADYVNSFKNTIIGSSAAATAGTTGGASYTPAVISSTGVPVSIQEAAINSAILGGLTSTNNDLYTIKGKFGTINEIEDAKLRIDPLTGEVGIYTKNNLGQYSLSGGIGRYGAQSGEYTIVNENTGKTINLSEISPFWTENLGKVSAPGANIPWYLSSGAAGLGTVSEKGLGTSFTIENAAVITPSISKLTGAISSSALAAANPETYTITGKFGDVGEITGAKIIYNPLTGEAGIYSQRNAIAGMKSSGNQWALTAGIGMYGDQSGEYTITNEQNGQKTNLASLVTTSTAQSNKQYAISLPWNIAGWNAGLSEAVNGTINGISSATKGYTVTMPTQIAAAEPVTVVKANAAQASNPITDIESFLSGAINFWTPAGIAGTKNVIEGSVPIAGSIPYIGSTINSVAAWITPQGMAQVTTPAGLQVQKDASAALSNVQTIKAQYDVAKGQYDTDIAAARAAGYINAGGEITDSKTYAKLSGEIDAVNALSGKLNEANTKYTSVYDNAVKEGLYTVDKSGNYIPTTKAQSSAMDQIDLWASPILKGAGFSVSTDYSKIEQKPVIQTPLYDIYQSFEKNFAQPFTIGAATEVQEKPASAAFNFAVGVGLALATEGFGNVVARSATLSRVGGIVSPTIYTTRAGTEIGLVPAALSGIYAASIPYRATDELTNFEPKEVSKNLGGILATETGPMIAGGYLGTVGYSKAAASLSQSNIWDTMAGRENAYTIETTPIKPISETIGDMVYAARQKSMGIENIGPKSGLTYYSENFETPWQTSEAARQTPAGISGYLNAVNPTYEEAVGGIYSKSTALTTVPYERTILGSAYDISYANAQYLPQEELLKLQTSRTVITPEGYGGIKVAEQFTPLTLSSEAYARATGIDLLPQTPSTSEVVDVFRTQTIRDVYPSGRTYENVVGRKGQAVLPGREISDIISSRGITFGEFSTYQRMISAADQMIETTIVKETPSRISVVDLPTTIKDISVGYGSTEISPLSGTSTMQQATRVVRAGENYETVFGREALNKMEVGAPLGVLFPGSERTVSGLFETLPEYGVKSTEVFGATEGMRPAPVVSSENIYEADKEISDLLYGQNAGRFGTEAQRLRETGTEKVLRSGFERSGGVITPLSKTFGKTRYGAPAESGGGRGNPALLMSGVFQEENLKTAQHIGSMIENVLGKSRAKEEATETQEQATTEEIRSGLSAYSPRQALFEEDYGYTPSEQVLERVGLKARGVITRPAEEARMNYGISVIPAVTRGTYQISEVSRMTEAEQLRESANANIEDVLFRQEVIPTFQSDILGKQATAQTERQAQREAQVTDQSILQDILGKQIVTPDVARDVLGRQITTPVPALSILTEITLPRVTEVPPVEPVKVEKPKPTKITWPDLSSLAQGGAWGSGKLTGTVFTERLQLKSMRQVLGGIMPQQQKRKR